MLRVINGNDYAGLSAVYTLIAAQRDAAIKLMTTLKAYTERSFPASVSARGSPAGTTDAVE